MTTAKKSALIFLFTFGISNCVLSAEKAPRLIALDVGHSLAQPGSTSARGKPEFAFNLALAETISQHFHRQNLPHTLIGADGKMLDLKQRTQQAQQRGASFFLAIHHDSAQAQYFSSWQWQGETRRYSDKFKGYSLFVSRKNPASQTSLACAKAIGTALRAAGLSPTAHHAENIPGENREWADETAGVYYFDDLVVLKTASMPALLLEAGVIVNRDEELALESAARQALIAKAVTQGLQTCGVAP